MTQLLLNTGQEPTEVSVDYFLELFQKASYSTPFEVVKGVVEHYRKFATPEELAELQRLGLEAQQQYLTE